MTTSLLMPNPPKVIAPPFTLATATQKVRLVPFVRHTNEVPRRSWFLTVIPWAIG
jgi:hypothetical protein